MSTNQDKVTSNRATRLFSVLTIAIATAVGGVRPSQADPSTHNAPAVQAFPSEVSIPNTRRFDFTSKVNGHRYSISIALPFEPPAGQGYGVLYILDGYWYFASAADAVRAPDRAPGVVVVGIEYPDDAEYMKHVLTQRGPVSPFLQSLPPLRAGPYFERMYDLSLPTSDEALRRLAKEGFPKWDSQNFGGLDDLLKIIEIEIKPRVAALAHIDSANQALFGHSFGGYAALHAMFLEPDAFRTYIIASPAIYWDNKEVLRDEQKFATAVETHKASPRVLVTVGGDESTSPSLPASWKMVENGQTLVAWLKSLRGSAGYVVEDYAVFDKTNHFYSAWPALARGISFAFPAAARSIRTNSDDPSRARR